LLNKRKRTFIKENLDKLSLEEMAKELGIPSRKLEKELKKLRLQSGTQIAKESPTPSYKTYSISSKNRKKIVVMAVLVFLFTSLVYFNTLNNDFIWDDEYLILNNSQIKSFSHILNVFRTYVGYGSENVNTFYRPMQELSNMVDYFLWARDPKGFHLTNLLLHAVCAVLVFIFVFYLCGNAPVSFLTGLFYGIHPIHTEAVAYIAGRADSLYSIFFLLSFIYFIKYTNRLIKGAPTGILLYLSVGFFIPSLLSKEIGMILPLLLVLYIFVILKNRIVSNAYNRIKNLWIPYAAVVLVYIFMRFTVLNFFTAAPPTMLAAIPFLNRMLTFCKTVLVYFGLLLFPVGLHMERTIRITRYLLEPSSLVALVVVFGALAGGFTFYKKNRLVSFFIFWFFINLLPMSNIYPINSFLAEHWLYMASVGYFFAISAFLYALYKKGKANIFYKSLVILFIIALFLVYSLLTIARNQDWKDEISFFENTLKYSPKNARLYLNLGNTYYERKELDKAFEQYEKSIAAKPNNPEAYGNIGALYTRKGNLKEAENYLKKAIELNFADPIAHYNLARVYVASNRRGKAIEELEASVKYLPQFYQASNMLGELYMKSGDKAKALESFRRSLRVMPNQGRIKSLVESITR